MGLFNAHAVAQQRADRIATLLQSFADGQLDTAVGEAPAPGYERLYDSLRALQRQLREQRAELQQVESLEAGLAGRAHRGEDEGGQRGHRLRPGQLRAADGPPAGQEGADHRSHRRRSRTPARGRRGDLGATGHGGLQRADQERAGQRLGQRDDRRQRSQHHLHEPHRQRDARSRRSGYPQATAELRRRPPDGRQHRRVPQESGAPAAPAGQPHRRAQGRAQPRRPALLPRRGASVQRRQRTPRLRRAMDRPHRGTPRRAGSLATGAGGGRRRLQQARRGGRQGRLLPQAGEGPEQPGGYRRPRLARRLADARGAGPGARPPTPSTPPPARSPAATPNCRRAPSSRRRAWRKPPRAWKN